MKRIPLGTRFLWMVMLYSSVLTLLFVGVNLYARYQQELRELDDRVSQLRTTTLPALTQSVWDLDQSQTELQLLGITQVPDVVSARLVTTEGVVTSLGQVQLADRHFFFSVNRPPQELAQLDIGVSYQRIYEELWEHAVVLVLTQGIKTFLVSLLIVVLVGRMITRHLESLSSQLGEGQSHFELHRREAVQDELSTLVEALNKLHLERDQQMAALAASKAELDNQHQHLAAEVARQTAVLRQENELAVLMGELAAGLLEQRYDDLDKGLQQALALLGRKLGLESITLFEQILVRAHWPQDASVWPLWSSEPAQKALREGQHYLDEQRQVLALPLKDQGLSRGALMLTGDLGGDWVDNYFNHLHRFTSFIAALLARQQSPQLFTPLGWQRPQANQWQDEIQGRTTLAAMAAQQAQAGGFLTVVLWEFSGPGKLAPDRFAELRSAISHGMPEALFVRLSQRLLMVAVAGPGPQAINTLVSALLSELRELARPLEVHAGGFCLVPANALPYEQLLEMADRALFQARRQTGGLVMETSNA
ncbi:sensor histidine kinase [Gallaecimonas xiamenensis]|uniref:Sensor histidine kinase/response regulator n=1 Tax=Gallaecimonas xiamenensis 3-C-1 TaxID=745411 RepID=K2ILP0_9GAMM|nr:sensor histidine kinase [Gallaecimonas xiamenensis]EKE71071.1 sensor histidine kinase/response regulator [Gallaecimonas xiamenensis 3-C-1]